MPDETEVPPINTPWYLDKALYAKLLLPVITLATAYLNSKLPIPLDASTMAVLVGGFCATAVSYIIGNKAKTTILQRAGIEAAAKVVTKEDALKEINKQ